MAVTRATHWIGVLFLFVSSVLLLFVTISAPIINHIGFLDVRLANGTKDHHSIIYFGTFGYCTSDAGPDGNGDTCTPRHIGYEPAWLTSKLSGAQISYLSAGTSDSLTRVMVLHPIAAGVAFIAFLVSLGGHIIGSLASAAVAGLAWMLTLVAMAIDFTIFEIVKHNVNTNERISSEASWGSAIWTLVAAFVLLGFGTAIVLLTSFGASRERARRAREKERV
ncbi:hypothetical protein DOTSEDRAFT_22469 [Dothistroma septosporum NZE10]|uniref:Pali-domain-containing protein n=1 Tax=Dothistroma septosporum (strain NZE10 / CBS 128990) TaxID=675120 RepID=N1PVK9_DOTSN|nr:hypothetical protein DOTSEDRAFT_22469 [Dothistroma septosporum NZE10]